MDESILIGAKIIVALACVYIVLKIGQSTGYWRAWAFITLGITILPVVAILQLIEEIDPFSWSRDLTFFTIILLPFVSIMSLAIGFRLIQLQINTALRHGLNLKVKKEGGQ
jgi:hypothetical protein